MFVSLSRVYIITLKIHEIYRLIGETRELYSSLHIHTISGIHNGASKSSLERKIATNLSGRHRRRVTIYEHAKPIVSLHETLYRNAFVSMIC